MAEVTFLFVPGDRPDRFGKALASDADRVILDLEDAVRPEAKPAARGAVAAADPDARLMVRVNPPGSPFWEEDLNALAGGAVAAVVMPKAECAEDVARLQARLDRAVEVLPQVETARGLDAVDELLAAPGVRRVAFGHLDYALDIGAAPEWEPLVQARAHLVWRSRVAGRAAPVDSVTPEIDADAVTRDARGAAAFGFGGKLLIHPSQVAPAARAFAPDPAELDWARRTIAAVEAKGAGAVAVDGHMIDKPVEDAARRILARMS